MGKSIPLYEYGFISVFVVRVSLRGQGIVHGDPPPYMPPWVVSVQTEGQVPLRDSQCQRRSPISVLLSSRGTVYVRRSPSI